MGKHRHIHPESASSRRAFLRLAASGLVLPLGAMAPASWRQSPSSTLDTLIRPPICSAAASVNAVAPGATPRVIKISFSPNAVCTVGIPVADQKGFFAKRNLKAELINFSTDQLLELIASGRADAGVSMALGWLKPLEQGFDVKLTTGIHGGCIRLLTSASSDITSVAALKGKAVGTFAMASPDRNFVSVLAAKRGLDPSKDIDWRVYPPDLLGVALQRGEIQAFSSIDPMAAILRDRDHLTEVANNLSDEFADRTCCVLGLRGSLVRDDPQVAAAITAALLEAQEWVAANPDGAGAIFAGFTKVATADQLATMLRTHNHHHHPTDVAFKHEIALYAQELKHAGVFKPSTDPTAFADRVCVNVLTA